MTAIEQRLQAGARVKLHSSIDPLQRTIFACHPTGRLTEKGYTQWLGFYLGPRFGHECQMVVFRPIDVEVLPEITDRAMWREYRDITDKARQQQKGDTK